MNIIETDRLIIREFNKDDYLDLYKYINHIDINCFKCLEVNSIKEAKKELKKRIRLNKSKDDIYLAICLKDSNTLIGEVSAHLETIDFTQKIKDTYSISYLFNKDHMHKGYAYESIYAFLSYLFKKDFVHRVYAYVEDYNTLSINLLKKLNFRKEGEFKEFVSFIKDEFNNQIYENTCVYAILKKEFFK